MRDTCILALLLWQTVFSSQDLHNILVELYYTFHLTGDTSCISVTPVLVMYSTNTGHDTVVYFIRPQGLTFDPLWCAGFSNM